MGELPGKSGASSSVAAALAEIENAGQTLKNVRAAHDRVFGVDPASDVSDGAVVIGEYRADGTVKIVEIEDDPIGRADVKVEISAEDVGEVERERCRIHRSWKRVGQTWMDKAVEHERVQCEDCGHTIERRVANSHSKTTKGRRAAK